MWQDSNGHYGLRLGDFIFSYDSVMDDEWKGVSGSD